MSAAPRYLLLQLQPEAPRGTSLERIRAGGIDTMMRVTAAVAVVFAVGAGAMTVLGAWLGGSAEAASLGLVGAGLVGTSYVVGGRFGARAPATTRALEETHTA